MTRLKGKVALITGGASGIGLATVRLFVEEGAAVMVADLDDERGRRLAGELGSRGGYVHTDVSREADIKAAVDETCKRFGQLDCIFNNAGYAGVGGKIEDVSAEGFDTTIGVLLRGVHEELPAGELGSGLALETHRLRVDGRAFLGEGEHAEPVSLRHCRQEALALSGAAGAGE